MLNRFGILATLVAAIAVAIGSAGPFTRQKRRGMRRVMRSGVVCLMLVAMLAVSAVAATAGLTGTYATTITGKHGVPSGLWRLDFKPSGELTLSAHGTALGTAKFLSSTTEVKIKDNPGPGTCPGTGVYKFKLTGRTLRFRLVNDPTCAGRRFVLSHTFTKGS
jgi:hypothetical protein